MRKTLVSIVMILLLSVCSLATTVYPLTIVDDLGRMVSIDTEPQRVVIAAPAITNFLIKLGISDRIVGVTDFDPFQGAEKIGQMVPLNVEKILSLNPDVVLLAGGFQEPEVYKLEKLGIKAVVINPVGIDDIFKDTMIIASIFNVRDKGNKLVKKYRDIYLSIAKKAYKIPLDERPRVFYGMPNQNMSEIWTCGSGSYMNEIINLAGGVNVAAGYTGNNGWFPVGPEFVLKANPDIIVVPYWYAGGEKAAVDQILNYEPWKNVEAVKARRVYAVDGNLASQPNLKLFDLMKELYRLFYEE